MDQNHLLGLSNSFCADVSSTSFIPGAASSNTVQKKPTSDQTSHMEPFMLIPQQNT